MRLIKISGLIMWYLLLANTTFAFNRADTLRGSNGPGRNWWAVERYDLNVSFAMKTDVDGRPAFADTAVPDIKGVNQLTMRLTADARDSMQIDLQWPMVLDYAIIKGDGEGGEKLKMVRDSNVYWLHFPARKYSRGAVLQILLGYHGKPHRAVHPPWDGGFSWNKDTSGKAWLAVSCQGLGASVWWPCKDIQSEEPGQGMTTTLVVPGNLAAISNGRLVARRPLPDGTTSWQWEVRNPINSYNVTFYIGDYVNWHDTLMGEKGMLDLDFWVLRYNEAKARKQFAMVKQMLHCFEYWMGPYPFYEDGYKLVEAPYLGMEHQSAVAYGNEYRMGYRGYDRTGTGIGMNFDYIIVHETGHEWFGNNVTAADMADNWVHEGITTYSESLFEECLTNKEKGQEYCRGEWNNILNNKPIIGPYGVNEEGSGDMYDKGAAIMHMVRVLTGDDEKFRQMLRALGREYYHGIVLTVQVESFIAGNCALDLKAFFDQYLRTDSIPELEYYIKNKTLYYRFNNIVPDFTLPVTIRSKKVKMTISPTAAWQEVKWKGGYHLDIEKNFLITIKN